MKWFFSLLCVFFISVSAHADLIRPIFFSDIKYPQRCENLCEILKKRLIGVSDTQEQERLLRDYDECKSSYDKAVQLNAVNEWCVGIYTFPCHSACQIKCGGMRCIGKEYQNKGFCAPDAIKKCQEEGNKRCAACKEQKKDLWHTYLNAFLRSDASSIPIIPK